MTKETLHNCSIFSVSLFLMLFTFIAPGHASCVGSHPSLESIFIGTDVIFKGKVSGYAEGGVLFDIEKLYKAPTEHQKAPQAVVQGFRIKAEEVNELIGQEWLVYGMLWYKNDKKYLYVDSSLNCGKTFWTGKQILSFLDTQTDDYMMIVDENASTPIVVKARLVRMVNEYRAVYKQKAERSDLEFKIEKVYRNEKNIEFPDNQLKTITLSKCSNMFRVNGVYILRLASSTDRKGEIRHHLKCHKTSLVDIHEEQELEKLEKYNR